MVYFAVPIHRPPENTTACRGSNVTVSCGYISATAVPVTWIINGTSFDQEMLENSQLYQLDNPIHPLHYSLTVFSINHTTTFQCIVHTTSGTTSTPGTVTVIGMYVHTYMYIVICCTYNI